MRQGREDPSINDERWLVRLASASIEVELVDDARRYALMLLTEEEQQTVWTGREDVDDGVRISGLQTADDVCDLFGECGRMASAGHVLLTRAGRKRHADQCANLG